MEICFAELFNTLFFAGISLVAWFVPLPLHRRIIACAIGAFDIATAAVMRRYHYLAVAVLGIAIHFVICAFLMP
jgi:hypothetical protein